MKKFILNLCQGYLHIYYNILYYPPKYIHYINNVNIRNLLPTNHQAYHYYDVDIRFQYDFQRINIIEWRIMNTMICMQRWLMKFAPRLWINLDQTNDWKSFLHRICWLTIEHHPLYIDKLNCYRGKTIAIPCVDKSAVANPKLHCLHFLRRMSLCDGAMHLCVASPL